MKWVTMRFVLLSVLFLALPSFIICQETPAGSFENLINELKILKQDLIDTKTLLEEYEKDSESWKTQFHLTMEDLETLSIDYNDLLFDTRLPTGLASFKVSTLKAALNYKVSYNRPKQEIEPEIARRQNEACSANNRPESK